MELLTGPAGAELRCGWLLENGTGNGNIMYSYDGISWSDSVGGTSFSNYGNGSGLRDQRGRNSDVGGCWK